MYPSNKTKPVGWQIHMLAALVIGCIAIAVSFAIAYFVPATNKWVLAFLQARIPSLASWIQLQSWAGGSSMLVLAVVAMGLYIVATLFFKSAGKRLWQRLTGKLAAGSTPATPPMGCYALETLANELFPQLDAGAPSLNFVGREAEQQWLSTQCTSTKTSGGIRIVSLWGPQGIGKTHLAYVFARALSKGDYVSLGRWNTYRLDKEFDPQDLIGDLPAKPVLLLLDDVSLADDTSHRRLQKLIQTASSRKPPLLVLLTAWQPRLAEGLSQSEKLVDAELEVKPLEDQFARQLYQHANLLPPALRGHPLMLRLLEQKPSDAGTLESQLDLWSACLAWATGFAARLRKDYAMSDRAMQAFATASSSDSIKWASLSFVFKLDDADFQAIKKTGRITERQGALSVAPLRPDLLGWAFAIQVFQATTSEALKEQASLAWEAKFF
jgi:hypothetical protein